MTRYLLQQEPGPVVGHANASTHPNVTPWNMLHQSICRQGLVKRSGGELLKILHLRRANGLTDCGMSDVLGVVDGYWSLAIAKGRKTRGGAVIAKIEVKI